MTCQTCENMQTHTILEDLLEHHSEDELLHMDLYNVYSICEGAIEDEESFNNLDDAEDFFRSLEQDAKNHPDVEITIHLYDLVANQLIAEITV